MMTTQGHAQTRSDADGTSDDSPVCFETVDNDAPADPANAAPAEAILNGDRRQFLQTLSNGECQGDIGKLLQDADNPFLDEGAACEAIGSVVANADDRDSATTIIAALSARIVAQSLKRAGALLDQQSAEVLLAAFGDAARDIAAARAAEGLQLLPAVATLMGRRAAERGDHLPVIADAVRHIAGRLAADPTLGRGLASSAHFSSPDRPQREKPGPPRRIVLHGPVEIAFHAR